MFEILPSDWNLKSIFAQKWASVDVNWGGWTPPPGNSNPGRKTTDKWELHVIDNRESAVRSHCISICSVICRQAPYGSCNCCGADAAGGGSPSYERSHGWWLWLWRQWIGFAAWNDWTDRSVDVGVDVTYTQLHLLPLHAPTDHLSLSQPTVLSLITLLFIVQRQVMHSQHHIQLITNCVSPFICHNSANSWTERADSTTEVTSSTTCCKQIWVPNTRVVTLINFSPKIRISHLSNSRENRRRAVTYRVSFAQVDDAVRVTSRQVYITWLPLSQSHTGNSFVNNRYIC